MFAPHPSLAFLDIGGPELMMVMLVMLLLFPSKRIPELARGIGKTLREFKKAASGFEDELRRAIETPPPPRTPPPGVLPTSRPATDAPVESAPPPSKPPSP